jgi:hypothetical protein
MTAKRDTNSCRARPNVWGQFDADQLRGLVSRHIGVPEEVLESVPVEELVGVMEKVGKRKGMGVPAGAVAPSITRCARPLRVWLPP